MLIKYKITFHYIYDNFIFNSWFPFILCCDQIYEIDFCLYDMDAIV